VRLPLGGRFAWGVVVVAVVVLLGGAGTPPARAAGPVVVSERQLYVRETGQTLRGPFLAYWLGQTDHSGTGLPVSPAKQVGGGWVQWFEYARLEVSEADVHATSANPVRVVPLGRVFANWLGYTHWMTAFTPRAGAGAEARYFPATGHSVANGMLAAYASGDLAGQLGLPISEEFAGANGTTYQFFEFGALEWLPGVGARRMTLGVSDALLHNQLATWQPRPAGAVEWGSDDMLALSDLLVGERLIEIDIDAYTLTAWVGEIAVLTTTVVTGYDLTPTPTGEFAIYLKNDVQTLQGVIWDGTPYLEPDVPWVMYFYEDFAIHPSNWRTEFGMAASPGCVIPPLEVAEQLYAWADYGTRVIVHE
jgi:hypothetical protein